MKIEINFRQKIISSKNPLNWICIIFLFFLFNANNIHSATNLYVQSPLAKLLKEPNASSPGVQLTKGESLTQIGASGMFLKVRSAKGEGYVMQLYVSQIPPGKKLDIGSTVSKTTSINARLRASSFTETAAARGLTESQKMRTRGKSDDYDFESLKWIEKFSYSEKDFTEMKDE